MGGEFVALDKAGEEWLEGEKTEGEDESEE